MRLIAAILGSSVGLMGCGGEISSAEEAESDRVSSQFAQLRPSSIPTAVPMNPCADPDRTGVKVIPPTSGVYHGVHLGLPDDVPITDEVISDFEKLAGKKLALVYFDNPWGKDGKLDLRFPTATVQTVWNHGAVPFVRLMPWTARIEDRADSVVSLKKFVDTTQYDSAVKDWLLAAKATKIPILVQFGVEVNGKWFPWNGYWNGRGTKTWRDPSWPDGPEAYRLSYQKLIDMARDNGVWNITWAFHVSHWPIPSESSASWNQMKYYYPGDSYIDWIGLSCYGEMQPFGSPTEWHPLSEILGEGNPQLSGGRSPYKAVVALSASTTKPLALFETAVVEDPKAGDKAAWIGETYQSIMSPQFARLRSVNWWNERWDNDPPMGPSDMRINSSAASQAGYRTAVSPSTIVSTPSFACRKTALP